MVPVAVASPRVTFCGLLRTTLKFSWFSSISSSRRVTVTVFSVSPMAKFRVPLAAVKSIPEVAVSVVPSSWVAQSTEAASSLLARLRDTANSMVPASSLAIPSATDTSGRT